MDEKPIALVTGANKGLGKEVARQLGKRGLSVYLGSRNWARGEEAAGQLIAEGLDVVPAQIALQMMKASRHSPGSFNASMAGLTS